MENVIIPIVNYYLQDARKHENILCLIEAFNSSDIELIFKYSKRLNINELFRIYKCYRKYIQIFNIIIYEEAMIMNLPQLMKLRKKYKKNKCLKYNKEIDHIIYIKKWVKWGFIKNN